MGFPPQTPFPFPSTFNLPGRLSAPTPLSFLNFSHQPQVALLPPSFPIEGCGGLPVVILCLFLSLLFHSLASDES